MISTKSDDTSLKNCHRKIPILNFHEKNKRQKGRLKSPRDEKLKDKLAEKNLRI